MVIPLPRRGNHFTLATNLSFVCLCSHACFEQAFERAIDRNESWMSVVTWPSDWVTHFSFSSSCFVGSNLPATTGICLSFRFVCVCWTSSNDDDDGVLFFFSVWPIVFCEYVDDCRYHQLQVIPHFTWTVHVSVCVCPPLLMCCPTNHHHHHPYIVRRHIMTEPIFTRPNTCMVLAISLYDTFPILPPSHLWPFRLPTLYNL